MRNDCRLLVSEEAASFPLIAGPFTVVSNCCVEVEGVDVELESLLARVASAAILEGALEGSRTLSARGLDQMQFKERSCFAVWIHLLGFSLLPIFKGELALLKSIP